MIFLKIIIINVYFTCKIAKRTCNRLFAVVACPANSSGTSVNSGCICNAGYQGSVVAKTTSPFYTSTCSPVSCPANSRGTSIPSGI